MLRQACFNDSAQDGKNDGKGYLHDDIGFYVKRRVGTPEDQGLSFDITVKEIVLIGYAPVLMVSVYDQDTDQEDKAPGKGCYGARIRKINEHKSVPLE